MPYIVKTLKDNVALPDDNFYAYANSTALLTDDEYNSIPAADFTNGVVELVEYIPDGGGGGAVTSVFGRTGDVVGAKADVGLGNVDNTSDASKPISTATSTALSGKPTKPIMRQAYITDQARVTLPNTAGAWAPLAGWPTLTI